MLKLFDNFLLSDKLCQDIVLEYQDKVKVIDLKGLRHQKNYHEYDTSHWIHSLVKKIITDNLGNNFKLYQRVTILRYDIGDFFNEHQDGPGNYNLNKNLPYHFYGGIELSNKNDFDGGEYFIEGKDIQFKKGRLFTHDFYDTHGIRTVTRGTRWSIHFLIYLEDNKNKIHNGII